MRTTFGRSHSTFTILREYRAKQRVAPSTNKSADASEKNSKPFRETVHLGSRARRIFRPSVSIGVNYIRGNRDEVRIHCFCSPHGDWKIWRYARSVERCRSWRD